MGVNTFDLAAFRHDINAWIESLHDVRGSYGKYISQVPYAAWASQPSDPGHFYASADIALLRGIMGEEFSTTLTAEQRGQWVNYLNSFQDPVDGSYEKLGHHSKLHANGTAVGAIGLLGGKMAHPVRLYEPFDTPEKIRSWLETEIDWSRQWTESHKFWGGIHCFSLGLHATPEWLNEVFAWLDTNLDERTGWWRKGTPHANRHEALGGSAHILPMYQHHHRPFPFARQLIDSVLALQLEHGHWLEGAGGFNYLDLDALYVYDFCKPLTGGYRKAEIEASVDRFSRWFFGRLDDAWANTRASHPHIALCMVGILGLLQRLSPGQFTDDRAWTDIFSDRRLYRTAEIEI